MTSMKAPPEKSVPVLKKSASPQQNGAIQEKVQQTMVQNNIPLSRSLINKEGDTVMICETKDDRDKLKDLLSNSDEQIEMSAPAEKRPSITIFGLKKEYEKEEIVQMLVLQNGFIKGFADTNNINEHIEIFAVRPLKNNPDCFQAFVNVSKTLREGFYLYKNKVTIGPVSCKIYDRFHVKRCNNCQTFGHYMNEYPTPEVAVCGKCRDCKSNESVCINCVRDNNEDTSHHTNSFKCPSLRKQQDIQKKKAASTRLNWTTTHHAHRPYNVRRGTFHRW